MGARKPMALTISLRADTEKRLEEQARPAGVDKSTYAAKLLEQSLLPDDWLEKLSGDVGKRIATIVEDAPPIYTHPIDPDDSIYINLAVATQSMLIISRDRHLLNLMDVQRSEGKSFHSLFPQLVIMPPDVFAQQLREEERKE